MTYSTVGYVVAICTFVFIGCNQQPKELIPYELVDYSGDIKVEKFDSTIKYPNRFNQNNQIYKVGREFDYTYDFISAEGDTKAFRYIDFETWEFVEQYDEDRITGLTLKVRNGLSPFEQMYPDYNQTIISYTYNPQDSYNPTGAIENEANVWVHPPRGGLLRYLQLNPYPYVEYPLEILNDWTWSFNIGNSWADDRWATWDSTITSTATYRLLSRETKETVFGELVVFTINAQAESQLGTTYAEFEFAENIGFLRMDFTNIDSSKIILKLEAINFD